MHKTIIAALLLAAALGVQAHEGGHEGGHGHAPAGPQPTAIATGNGGAYYGTFMPKSDPVAISAVAQDASKHTAAAQAFSGRITEVCQKQGCWMVLEDNGAFARVFMQGHGFSVPRETGRNAIVYGTLKVKQLDAKEIEHLASEGSKPAAQELQIEASSVWIAGG
jgi:Domain of unknown function (DUF4920)